MCKIELNATQVAAIYKGGNGESRKILKESIGERFSEVFPITLRVQSFDDAVKEIGDDHPLCQVLSSLMYGYRSDVVTKDLLAYLKIAIIAEALNEGWKPAGDENRWYPFFELSEDNDSVVFTHSGTTDPDCLSDSVKLAYKSEELASYAGETFADIYSDLVTLGKLPCKDESNL